MSVKRKIETELLRLEKELKRYEDGVSWDSKFQYYTISGKIDILYDLISYKKFKRKEVYALLLDVEEEYKKIRAVPKAERTTLQTIQGIYLEGKLDILKSWVMPMFSKPRT